ncbi:branched-chain amino acid ABC transporter permease [Actinacidiphila sp. ITFR-21]|uniref:branched-chain amino acid ABC transporter permease n=1 Tax=Actinacidiphila sp. ITFR-21 TaxID=3075199 RepID=UPI00288AAA20|nr:branched-chain amino acid ABC transporter permease [Streptomyces sp. ITFR-21]WNI18748.1 branched-chain amino acid ABC transporter permease [Streptomyces sp. ITFR-21]
MSDTTAFKPVAEKVLAPRRGGPTGGHHVSRRLLIVSGVFVLVAVVGFFVPSFGFGTQTVDLLGQGLVQGVAATGVGLLMRQTGLINFGAGALYGSGAYMFAIACTSLDLSMTSAFVLAVVATTVLSAIVGMLTVRSGHLGFAIMTVAFSQLLIQLVNSQGLRSVTHGTDGLLITEKNTLFGINGHDLFSPSSFWPLAWICALLAVVVAYAIEHSRFGRIARSIQENEERMRFAGFQTFWPKVLIFTIAGALAGIAGALSAAHYAFASTDLLGLSSGGDILFSSFLGGPSFPAGPMAGSVLFSWAQSEFGQAGQLELYTGIGIVVAIVLLRRGLLGAVGDLFRLARRTVGSHSKETPDASH